MELNIHKTIYDKLKYFIDIKKIPNIIFHGQSGSGKRTLLNNFIKMIYQNDKELIKSYVMYVNCAHGKGIKFIREELKFFAKIHINNSLFKSIILSNADKLTIDAQSALRRCIELFSHTTRFFIVIEDKYKLLKPILSRFCEIYIPLPYINNEYVNLHKYHINNIYQNITNNNKKKTLLKKILNDISSNTCISEYLNISNNLYEKGFSALDLIDFIENNNINQSKKYHLLLTFNKIKKEFRNEKLLMLFILNLFYIKENSFENISFM